MDRIRRWNYVSNICLILAKHLSTHSANKVHTSEKATLNTVGHWCRKEVTNACGFMSHVQYKMSSKDLRILSHGQLVAIVF